MSIFDDYRKAEENHKNFKANFDTGFPVTIGLIFYAYFALAIFIEFANFNKDTSSLTSYGFAILIGISSVSFSWARNIQHEARASRINDNAVDALYGAIVFLLGSALKYIAFAKDINIYSNIFRAHHWLTYIPKSLSFICFLVATFKCSKVIRELLMVISLYKHTRQEEMKDKTTWE